MTREEPELAQLMELAGIALAHSVWIVSDGTVLSPVVWKECQGDRTVAVFESFTSDDPVAMARRHVDEIGPEVDRAVVVVDGYVTVGNIGTDALVAEARTAGLTTPLTLLVRYRPADRPGGFAVLGDTLFCGPFDEATGSAYLRLVWAGVEQHKEGARVWKAHLQGDQWRFA